MSIGKNLQTVEPVVTESLQNLGPQHQRLDQRDETCREGYDRAEGSRSDCERLLASLFGRASAPHSLRRQQGCRGRLHQSVRFRVGASRYQSQRGQSHSHNDRNGAEVVDGTG
jgi:hypothetical protein